MTDLSETIREAWALATPRERMGTTLRICRKGLQVERDRLGDEIEHLAQFANEIRKALESVNAGLDSMQETLVLVDSVLEADFPDLMFDDSPPPILQELTAPLMAEDEPAAPPGAKETVAAEGDHDE